jgi:hypothetical protein
MIKEKSTGVFPFKTTWFCKNTQLSDVITIIGTLGLVLGEADRTRITIKLI